MSTNNNRLGKEVKPDWLPGCADDSKKLPKLSGARLAKLMATGLADVTALTLSYRSVERIEDLHGLSSLRRLDLSFNFLTRLSGMADLTSLSLLNVSNNDLSCEGLEELRYLPELRTLNIGSNPRVRNIVSHIVKPVPKLAALIANECTLDKASFVRFLPALNTLILSKNSISQFPSCALDSLTKLNLSHNAFTEMPDLTHLCALIEFKLSHNSITAVPESFARNRKLKIVDLSSNRLGSWADIKRLTELAHLTNATLRGNPLPAPPAEVDELFLREDVGADRLEDEAERRYRHYALTLFQRAVGKEGKLKVQLVVLDSIRVKAKWSHHEGGSSERADVAASKAHVGAADETPGRKRARAPVAAPEERPVAPAREPSSVALAAGSMDSGVVKVKVGKALRRRPQEEGAVEAVLSGPSSALALGVGLGGDAAW